MNTITHARGETARPVTPHDPIEFILAEHLMHRAMCKELERLASMAGFEPAPIEAMAAYIRVDLALHIRDEEEDFFPMLRKCCQPDDEISPILRRLSAEHQTDKRLSARVVDFLDASLAAGTPLGKSEGAVEALKAFSENERRHLALENAVIIPIARRRFERSDLQTLSRRLLARRRQVDGAGTGGQPK